MCVWLRPNHHFPICDFHKWNTTITKVCIWLRPNHHFPICVPTQMEHNEHKTVHLAEAKPPLSDLRALESSGEFWRALASSGELWRALASSGELWRALESSGADSRALESSGELWRALESSGEFWRVLENSGELSRASHAWVEKLRLRPPHLL